VKVTCGGKEVQATSCEEATTTPIWNQSFTFSELFLSSVELQTYELTVEVIDYNSFYGNVLIGSYSIGLSTLHKSKNHEFFNNWFTESY
jgi:Ca2+-dependent lipid-binding protein